MSDWHNLFTCGTGPSGAHRIQIKGADVIDGVYRRDKLQLWAVDFEAVDAGQTHVTHCHNPAFKWPTPQVYGSSTSSGWNPLGGVVPWLYLALVDLGVLQAEATMRPASAKHQHLLYHALVRGVGVRDFSNAVQHLLTDGPLITLKRERWMTRAQLLIDTHHS